LRRGVERASAAQGHGAVVKPDRLLSRACRRVPSVDGSFLSRTPAAALP